MSSLLTTSIWISNIIIILITINNRYTKNSTLDVDDTEYELFALTVHIGSLDGGHYIAYTKRNTKWYLFNDEDYE